MRCNVEFNSTSLTSAQLDALEAAVNDAIAAARPVTTHYKDETSDVRIVVMDQLDSNPCCGTHVQHTGQLQVEPSRSTRTGAASSIRAPPPSAAARPTNAMIFIRPDDADWRGIQQLTGDKSWAPGKMNAYFRKLERCRHRKWPRFLSWFGLGLLRPRLEGLAHHRARPARPGPAWTRSSPA